MGFLEEFDRFLSGGAEVAVGLDGLREEGEGLEKLLEFENVVSVV